MGAHVVGRAGDLPPGERLIVTLEGRSIGVFNVNGTFHALRNQCPHQQAPLCRGALKGLLTADDPDHVRLTRHGEILRCPWHGWEFDVLTGRSVFNPHKLRVRSYEVTVEPDRQDGREDEDPSIETFPVDVRRGRLVVHVPGGRGASTEAAGREEVTT
ncbi:MAG: Rieske (2Fe-2S) protein [Candidatus Dormibacteraeota bacterium]|nr:Rieske (2Fe-2S) protein [Candidatus Dormibacteraeota bacterium]